MNDETTPETTKTPVEGSDLTPATPTTTDEAPVGNTTEGEELGLPEESPEAPQAEGELEVDA